MNDYIDAITNNLQNIGPLQRWYLISSRVCTQAYAWDLDVRQYVGYIERFYNNVDYAKLKAQLDFEQEWTQDHDNSALLSLDPVFYDLLCSATLSYSFEDFMYCYGDTLLLYDVDPEKFFFEKEYRDSLHFSSSYDYVAMQIDYNKFLKDSCKTKRKNDYLSKHPKLWNKVYNY